ncbi:MAG: helicase [Bifidobacterium psychraerophilum]|uniref:helicase n=1 Tax=Bifidobacterium psychraerophilum TaxID=218140 RepID=UPI0039E7BD2D
MSESQRSTNAEADDKPQETPLSLDRIRQWRRSYQAGVGPTPLEDISQLSASLDLTHAHPSGIAQLFASGQVHLDALFRDNGMLRAANRRLERVLDDRATKERISGCAELSLIIGVATWQGSSMPVLLYPVNIERNASSFSKSMIRFTGKVDVNSALVSALRERGVNLDVKELFDASRYEGGTPESSALFSVISGKANGLIPGFAIERKVILGCFVEPSALLMGESLDIIDRLAEGPVGNPVLDALAGDTKSIAELSGQEVPEFSPFDADPHAEFEIGDVRNSVRYAAQLASAGRSVFVDEPAGKAGALHAAAIASRCVMNGRSVLYVPGVADQKKRFAQELRASEMNALMLDVTESNTNAQIDRQLINAVGFQPGSAVTHFDQLADELVGVRSRLTRYLGDLHGISEQWGVSAYQTIQNLANIAALPTHPATHVRLSPQTTRSLVSTMQEWCAKLERAAELGEFTIGPDDTAWYKASLYTEDDAVTAYERVVRMLEKLLPATRTQVASTVNTCGFPVPATAQDWSRQVVVLRNLRRVLDVFQPEIFERDIAAMIEASKSKAKRKTEGTSMGFWERRRHIKEAKSLLRAGAQVENLHDALVVVAKQSEQWRSLVPHGGWPVLPARLDDIMETEEAMSRDMTALNVVLASTPEGGALETIGLNDVEDRLKRLFEDHLALESLPERSSLEREFDAKGLTELVDDLHARHVAREGVGAELQLAWWTTVFEDIVRSSAIISNQDGSALSNAAERFNQVDTEHVRSIGAMVAQESTRRLSEQLFARTQEANQLHTLLAGSHKVSLSRLRKSHQTLFSAAKPILVATPATLAALTDPEPLADLAIIDAASHLPSIELLSVLSRVKQVVIIAHGPTVTSEGLRDLMGMLVRIPVDTRPDRRPPELCDFLERNGYGDIKAEPTSESVRGTVNYTFVNGSGVPVMSSGLVESSQQEINTVVDMLKARAASFTIVPASYVLSIITLSPTHRTRLGAELKACASKDKTFAAFLRHVRIIGVDEVAGAQASDVILSLGFAKTMHGRLLQQFGELEGEGGRGMLLDALALANRNLDIVSAFGSEDLEDERIHQSGPQLLKTMLAWAEDLDSHRTVDLPMAHESASDILLNDLAERIKARGLNVAVDYGTRSGSRIPLVVGIKGKPFGLAVLTDNADFMRVQSTRERHRFITEDLQMLGWSVITVWSVAAFVNPDKEVDRIVAQLAQMYGEIQ